MSTELAALSDQLRQSLIDKLDRLVVLTAKQYNDTASQCEGKAQANLEHAVELRQFVDDAEAMPARGDGSPGHAKLGPTGPA